MPDGARRQGDARCQGTSPQKGLPQLQEGLGTLRKTFQLELGFLVAQAAAAVASVPALAVAAFLVTLFPVPILIMSAVAMVAISVVVFGVGLIVIFLTVGFFPVSGRLAGTARC